MVRPKGGDAVRLEDLANGRARSGGSHQARFGQRTGKQQSGRTAGAVARRARAAFVSLVVILLALSLLSPLAAATDLTLTVGGRVTIELISSEAAFRNTLSAVSPAVTIAATGCKLEAAVGLPGG